MERPSRYPDLRELFAAKARGRRLRAKLDFAEKLAILERLREESVTLRDAMRAPAPTKAEGAAANE